MSLRTRLIAFLDFRSRIWLGIFGIGLAGLGIHEWRVADGAGDEPIPVALSALEEGVVPASPYIRLDGFAAHYNDLVYSTKDRTLPEERQSVEYTLVPIQSLTSEEADDFEARLAAGKDGPAARQTKVTVVLKTKRFRKVAEFPTRGEIFPSLDGMLIHKTEKLSTKEADLLHSITPREIWVLDEGRRPWSQLAIWSTVLGGLGALALVGYVSIADWRRSPAEVQAAYEAEVKHEPVDFIALFWMSLLYVLAGMTMAALVLAITTREWCFIVAAALPATFFNGIFGWTLYSTWFGKELSYGLSRRPMLAVLAIAYGVGIGAVIWLRLGMPGF